MKRTMLVLLALFLAAAPGCMAGDRQTAAGEGPDAKLPVESPAGADPSPAAPGGEQDGAPGQAHTAVEPSGDDPGRTQEPGPLPDPAGEPLDAPGADDADRSPLALQIGESLIAIGDWDDKVDLAALLGTPADERVIQLENADTHTGSFMKQLAYDGLEIDLFSPEHNGETFWILEMRISKEGIPTSRGIAIGSTLEEVLDAYAEFEWHSSGGAGKETRYMYTDDTYYEAMHVDVQDGRVTSIRLAGSL